MDDLYAALLPMAEKGDVEELDLRFLGFYAMTLCVIVVVFSRT